MMLQTMASKMTFARHCLFRRAQATLARANASILGTTASQSNHFSTSSVDLSPSTLYCLGNRSPNRLLSLSNPTSFAESRRFLNLQEYQSKQLMADNGVTVQRFKVVSEYDEACQVIGLEGEETADEVLTNCPEYVIKAQVLAGGRGKGHFKRSGMKGGVKLTKDKTEVPILVKNMINDYLVTAQTTSKGVLVNRVMIAEALDIDKELYLAILLDSGSYGPVIVVCRHGGMDIEQVAKEKPESIKRYVVPIDPLTSGFEMEPKFARKIASEGLGLDQPNLIEDAAREIQKLYKMFIKLDATQIEINPLGITPSQKVVCFDAKIQFDENASFRQSWVEKVEQENEEEADSRETLAKKSNLNFVAMEGNIGCLVNGAGLAMATMDIIHHYGGSPANFLDVGGSVNQAGVENAFKLITQDPSVKAILVNIFGGIVNCEIIANGLVAARDMVSVPIIVRFEGTNVESARTILSQFPEIITATDLDDAARKAVELAVK